MTETKLRHKIDMQLENDSDTMPYENSKKCGELVLKLLEL